MNLDCFSSIDIPYSLFPTPYSLLVKRARKSPVCPGRARAIAIPSKLLLAKIGDRSKRLFIGIAKAVRTLYRRWREERTPIILRCQLFIIHYSFPKTGTQAKLVTNNRSARLEETIPEVLDFWGFGIVVRSLQPQVRYRSQAA